MKVREIFEAVNLLEDFSLSVPPSAVSPQSLDLQKVLVSFGYDIGAHGLDGNIGTDTTAAIKKAQADLGLPANGQPDAKFIEILNKAVDNEPNLKSSLKQSSASDLGQNFTGKSTGAAGSALREPGFNEKLNQVGKNLGINTDVLLRIMKHESGLNPQAVNGMSKAVGLIQFIPKTAITLGTSVADLYKMTGTQQLDYVEQYYKTNGAKPGSSVGDLYLLTFMPAAKDKPDSYVLGNKGGGKIFGLSASAVYAQNKVFDHNGDGIFTVGDVKNRINSFA